MLRVENMTSPKSGRAVPNQFIIRDDATSRTVFQSYDSMIVTINYRDNTLTIGEDWNYGSTTSTYRNKFFKENGFSGLASTKELTAAINKGKFEDDGEVWTIITA